MSETKIKKPEVNEIATFEKDIDIFSGYIKRLENPDVVLRTEAAGKGLKLYDEVDRDAHASSELQTRYLAVVGREWQIQPAESARRSGRPSNESQEQKVADFIKSILLGCNFDQARQELMQAILYGYYPWEVMWDYSEGQVGIRKLFAKHPRRFLFDRERKLRMLTLGNQYEGEELPDRKFIAFTYGSSDNPYGKGLGQKLWWPVWFKKNDIKFWLMFCEKFGSPTIWGKYPPGTSPEEQAKLSSAIEAFQQETGLTTPNTMEVEFLEAARASSVNSYETLAKYMDAQMSKAVLGQTLTTEVGDAGSYAASQTHNKVRLDIVKADADMLCECLNDTLIKWIVDYNFPNVTSYPKIWIRVEEEKDLKALAERDKIVIKDIGFEKETPKDYIHDTYGIPRPDKDQEVLERADDGDTANRGNGDTGKGRSGETGKRQISFADSPVLPLSDSPSLRAAGTGQQAVDDLISKSLDDWEMVMAPLIDPIMELAGKSASLEEFRANLSQVYKAINDEPIKTVLARSNFNADAWGRLNA